MLPYRCSFYDPPAAIRIYLNKVLRELVLRIPEISDSYRLVHGEADGLSGLVIDKYAELLVVEPLSAGYLPCAETIAESLKNLYPGSQVVFRPNVLRLIGFGLAESWYPVPAPALSENPSFSVSWPTQPGSPEQNCRCFGLPERLQIILSRPIFPKVDT